MSTRRRGAPALLDEALLGAWLGLLVLGIGGRVAMRGIAVATGAPSAPTVGGTVTVLAAGAAAGAAGALLHALSRAVAARGAGGRAAVRVPLFAALLALVTARGLRGSPAAPSLAFWPLVLAYGVLLVRALARRTRGRAGDAPPARPATAGAP